MKRENRYGVRSLQKDFPNDEICLEFIFDSLHSRTCSCGSTYSLVRGRRQFQCSKCRFQIAPTAGTIFYKSEISLTLWFKAVLAFSSAKSGISAKYLERELEVGYKTAWRMLNLIRKALKQDDRKLKGDVEMDSSYFGGRYKAGKYNKYQKDAIASKSIVMGAIQRGGHAKMDVIPGDSAQAHANFLAQHIEQDGTRLLTDSTNRLTLTARGYDRHMVDHHRGEYVRGDVHINNVETFWSHVKRSIKGTHKVVSRKYLQEYLNGFVFHYNNRYSDKERFALLLGTVLRVAR